MLKFISFGSGSSGNCYYLYTEHDGVLIDVGVGIRTLKKFCRDYGISLSKAHHILITHDHADHIKSVGSLSHEFHLPVYATKAVHNGIDHNYCVQRKVAQELRRLVEPGVQLQIGDFLVTPFSVPHDASDNVGFMIEAEGVNFCLMTDVGHVTDEMKQFITQAQYLVIEANHDPEMLQQGSYPLHLKKRIQCGTGHLSNNACGEAIAQNMSNRLRYVWLCHLSQENNHPELARKTVEAVLRNYGIVVGKDLGLEVLKRTMPTGVWDLTVPATPFPNEPAVEEKEKAQACLKQNDLVGAIAHLTASLTIDNSSAELYLLRGRLRFVLGDKPGAQADMQRAIELDSSLAPRSSGVFTAEGMEHKVNNGLPNMFSFLRKQSD